MSTEREIMTWESFGVASRELAIQINDSGYEPDIILAIARGGLLAAGALGYALAVKNTYTMNVEFYTGVNERKHQFVTTRRSSENNLANFSTPPRDH